MVVIVDYQMAGAGIFLSSFLSLVLLHSGGVMLPTSFAQPCGQVQDRSVQRQPFLPPALMGKLEEQGEEEEDRNLMLLKRSYLLPSMSSCGSSRSSPRGRYLCCWLILIDQKVLSLSAGP